MINDNYLPVRICRKCGYVMITEKNRNGYIVCRCCNCGYTQEKHEPHFSIREDSNTGGEDERNKRAD